MFGSSDLAISQLLVSADCVFDASLVPGTCLQRFVDLKGFIQQVPREFYKKGSQEKTVPHRPELFLLRSPLD
jgi:hypothetical protein